MADFPFRRTPDKPEYTRKRAERVSEAKRAKAHFNSDDIQGIRAKLGLNSRTGEAKIKYTLRRYAKKPRSWKAIGLTKDDFSKFGIKIED